jgi:hypothetical protein
VNSKSYVTTPDSVFNYDMDALQSGVKCILLNPGGVAVMGSVTAATRRHFVGWAPMPKRDKERERQLGLKL